MRLHPRIRTSTTWCGLSLTLLMLIVWLAGGWCSVCYSSGSGHSWGIKYGCISHSFSSPAVGPSQLLWNENWEWLQPDERPPFRLTWWIVHGKLRLLGITTDIIAIPLWMPTALALLTTAAAWRHDIRARHRERARQCLGCGYSRAGLPIGACCPECGQART